MDHNEMRELAKEIANAMRTVMHSTQRGSDTRDYDPVGKAPGLDLNKLVGQEGAQAASDAMEKYRQEMLALQDSVQKHQKALKEGNLTEEERVKVFERMRDLLGDYNARERQFAKAIDTSTEATLESIKNVKDATMAMADWKKNLDDDVKAISDSTIQLNQMAKAFQIIKKPFEDFVKLGRDIGKIWGEATPAVSAFLDVMGMTGFGNKMLAATAVLKGVIENMFSFKAIFGGMTSAVFGGIGKLDEARSKFQQSVGPIGQYEESIADARTETLNLGFTHAEFMEQQKDLINTMASYRDMSHKTQVVLKVHSAVMARLGVDTKTTAETQKILNMALGMTPERSMAAQRSLVALAHDTGMSIKQVNDSFVKATETLAMYGDKASDEFVKLSQIARKAGVEVETFLEVAKRFDTIEGAANAVGDLNAMLGGGYIDTMNMLNASHSERILLMRQAIELSGKDIDSMARFEQVAMANALGMKNVAEMRMFMKQSVSDLTSAVQEEAMSEEEAAKRAAEMTEANAKFKALLDALYPIVQLLAKAAQWLSTTISGFVKDAPGAALAIALLTGAIVSFALKAVSGVLSNAADKLANKIVKVKDVVAMSTQQIDTMTAQASAASKKMLAASVGMLAFGAAILMIGYAIQLAGESKQPVLEVAGAMAILIVVFGAVVGLLSYSKGIGEVATLMFLALGAAIMLIGVGIGLASEGLTDMFNAMSNLKITGWEVMGILMGVALGIGAIGLALITVSTRDLISLSMLFMGLSNLKASEVTTSLGALKDSLSSIGEMAGTKTFSIMMVLWGLKELAQVKADWANMASTLAIVFGGEVVAQEYVRNARKTTFASVENTSSISETIERDVAIIDRIVDKKLTKSTLNIKMVIEGVKNEIFRLMDEKTHIDVLRTST